MQHRPGPIAEARSGTCWTVALYIRDALGLPFSPEIPRLAPAIPHVADPDAATPTADGWDVWVRRLAEVPAGSVTPPDHDPVLQTWYDRLEAEARMWEDRTARTGHYASELVPALLREAAGRGAHGVVHRTAIVSVEGRWHLVLRPDLLLVSVATWNDSAEMDRILEPLLRNVLGLPGPAPET